MWLILASYFVANSFVSLLGENVVGEFTPGLLSICAVHVKARHADNSRCRLIECLDEPLSGQCLQLQCAEQGRLNVFQRLAGTKSRFDAGKQRSFRCGLSVLLSRTTVSRH